MGITVRRFVLLLFGALPVWAAGAGLYCVQADGSVPGGCVANKTFTTITAAVAQLKTDQSTNDFTATQTIRVYDAATYPGRLNLFGLHPTSSYWLVLTSTATQPCGASVACPAVNNNGEATATVLIYHEYTSINGFEITTTTAVSGITSGSSNTNVNVTNCYLHDVLGNYGIDGNGAAWTIDHNKVYTVAGTSASTGVGIRVSANGTVTWNEVRGTNLTAIQVNGGTTGSVVRYNIVYAGNQANGTSGVWSNSANTIQYNVAYHERYSLQSQAASSPGPTFDRNIGVNSIFGCHCEGGASACWNMMAHNFCYGTSSGEELRQNAAAGTATAVYVNNISWPNGDLNASAKNVFESLAGQIATSDWNVYWKTGSPAAVGILNGTPYATLAAWQSGTGLDANTQWANPRLLGDEDLLVTTSQVCPAPTCATVEERWRYIWSNYMPTNLALKGRGRSWNGSTCVPDGSDIGPVTMTVYSTPGANMSTSIATAFSGGVAF